MKKIIDEAFLNQWIYIIVPKEYWPSTSPKAKTPLLGIYLVSDEKMETSKEMWFKLRGDSADGKLLGQLTNIGDLLRLVGKKPGALGDKYTIRLNENQSKTSVLFSLAHEIGHLHGEVTEDPKHEENPDLYADSYAFRRIKEVIRNERLRASIIYEALLIRV